MASGNSTPSRKQYLLMSKSQLFKICKKQKIKGYQNLSKQEIVKLLVPNPVQPQPIIQTSEEKNSLQIEIAAIDKLSVQQKKEYLVHGFCDNDINDTFTSLLSSGLVLLIIDFYGLILSLGKFDLYPDSAKKDIQ